jgi:hypothetical protein
MIASDRNALICDLAETYHILDYTALPVPLLATLSSGLRDDSRIKMKMSGIKPIPLNIMVARAADEISLFRYGFMDDAIHGRNMPDLFMTEMLEERNHENDAEGFTSGAEFDRAWSEAIKGVK